MENRKPVPVISVVGWAGSGKTTFLEKLVGELKSRGYRVGVIKHHRGPFEIDRPGKDTWRLARAGAACTAIAGPGRVGLVLQTAGELPPAEIAQLMPGMDLVITEGYKGENFPQLEVRRAESYSGVPASRPGQLLAVVTADQALGTPGKPCFDPAEAAAVADLIVKNYLCQDEGTSLPGS